MKLNIFDEKIGLGERFTLEYKKNEELQCVKWTRPDQKSKKVIIYLHGLQSHQGWFFDTANNLYNKNIVIYTYDRLGHGRSTNQTNLRGDCKDYNIHIESLNLLVQKVKEENPGSKIFLWANSYGAKIAMAYLNLHKNSVITKVILTTPGLFLNKSTLKRNFSLFNFIFSKKNKVFPSFIPQGNDNGANLFTKNKSFQHLIAFDNLSAKNFTKSFYIETIKLDRYWRNFSNKNLQVLLLTIKDDPMMDNLKAERWCDKNFSSRTVRFSPMLKKQHLLMFTSEHDKALLEILSFTKDSI
jgi:alpha-beta hydrolase superfamily lysophospholipase